MGRNVFETLMGAVVLVVAGAFVTIAWESGNVGATDGYMLMAKFDRADGLSVGSDVRMSGIKIGAVTDQIIDPLLVTHPCDESPPIRLRIADHGRTDPVNQRPRLEGMLGGS